MNVTEAFGEAVRFMKDMHEADLISYFALQLRMYEVVCPQIQCQNFFYRSFNCFSLDHHFCMCERERKHIIYLSQLLSFPPVFSFKTRCWQYAVLEQLSTEGNITALGPETTVHQRNGSHVHSHPIRTREIYNLTEPPQL